MALGGTGFGLLERKCLNKRKKLKTNTLAKNRGWHLCGQRGLQAMCAHTQQDVLPAAAPGCSQCWQCFGGLSWLFLSCLSRCPVWLCSHNHDVIIWIAFGIKNSFKLEWLGRDGSAGGKRKAPIPHPLDILETLCRQTAKVCE